jgi:hypothetical protein
MSESLTTKQVAEHNTVENGLYIIIDGGVYKMDTFVDEHPGGAKILKRVGGKDASKQFWKVCCISTVVRMVQTLDGADVEWLVSQRECTEEVRTQAESRNGQGGGKVIVIPIQRSLNMNDSWAFVRVHVLLRNLCCDRQQLLWSGSIETQRP